MSQYFQNSSKKGELYELRTDLGSSDLSRKKETLKKVIAQMTIGKDVSQLFQSVIKCLEHSDPELKKLVYLYIINYSRKQPDDAIMVVNLFRKDALTGTPLIKGLAVRTMGCLRVQGLNEYLAEPVKLCLKDKDAYVRKCAAFCVTKLYELSPETVEKQSMIQTLQQMSLQESNVMVLVNVVQALYDISMLKNQNLLFIERPLLNRLLTAVNETTEWGQGFILEILSNYVPADSAHAEEICERVVPRLQHINPTVVFHTIKLLVKYMDYISNGEFIREMTKKIANPLVTMVNWEWPEIQYVVLKNMEYILQKRPNILDNNIKCFFCKYYEPYYVKFEKVKLLCLLANPSNCTQILEELKEYAMDPEVEFSKEALRSVGMIALKTKESLEKATTILLSLVQVAVEQNMIHLVEESVAVFQTILRKESFYKDDYVVFFSRFQQIQDKCHSSSSKQALLWILGAYSHKVLDSLSILQHHVHLFLEYDRELQLVLLTTGIKVFLANPTDDSFIQSLLQQASLQSTIPEVRQRGNFYWTLLSHDTKRPLLIKMMSLSGDIEYEHHQGYSDVFLDKMINNLGTICSLVQKTPQQLFRNNGYLPLSQNEDMPLPHNNDMPLPHNNDMPLPHSDEVPPVQPTQPLQPTPVQSEDLIDLI